MAGVENAGPENTGTDLQGWKTRDPTTREPIAGVEKAEPERDNKSQRWKTPELIGFKLVPQDLKEEGLTIYRTTKKL